MYNKKGDNELVFHVSLCFVAILFPVVLFGQDTWMICAKKKIQLKWLFQLQESEIKPT